MTMDVSNNRKIELKNNNQTISETCEDQTDLTATVPSIKVVKRPFDVAFLMLPDEKLKQKQQKLLKHQTISIPAAVHHHHQPEDDQDDDDDDEEIEVGNNQDFVTSSKNAKYFTTQKQQIFDDPNNLIKAKNFDELRANKSDQQKSAFTKVSLINTIKEQQRLSPNLSISPDLSYQNSLSPSPPIRNSYQTMLSSPNHLFKNQTSHHHHHQLQQAYQNTFLPDTFTTVVPTTVAAASDPFLHHHHHQNFVKMRPMYRPELSGAYNYQQFQQSNQEMLKLSAAAVAGNASNGTGGGQGERGPASAAAILTSLLPPSLAALSLPAQNVCAKCNISFRMTSDLVYHMRSHHKNDSMDINKRRREEKLKCPVCSESFRERHHLTRHMTAHQDKEEDGNESGVGKNKNKLLTGG